MPGSKQALLTTDDALVRLIDLPDHERNRVLRTFARALAAAERRTLRAEHAAYDRLHPAGAPGSVLPLPRRASRRC